MGMNFARLSFLVVDDSGHMRHILRRMLESFGATDVMEAADGSEALQLIARKVPDILVTDWQMSPLDGISLSRALRDQEGSPNPFLPIIMVSGFSERDVVMAARDAGINEFLVKPVSARTLYHRISAVVEHARPFIQTARYFGPDRRRHKEDQWDGLNRRERPPRPAQAANARLSQRQISKLFNS